jgi:hypothetical protein
MRMLVATALESLWWAEWNYLLNAECLLKSVTETETIKVQFGTCTDDNYLSTIFGVNGSAIPYHMQTI